MRTAAQGWLLRIAYGQEVASAVTIRKSTGGVDMKDFKRRDFLKATAGVAAGTALGTGSLLSTGEAVAQTYKAAPEKGAKLRVLRWKRFVQGDEDVCAADTKNVTQMTSIEA